MNFSLLLETASVSAVVALGSLAAVFAVLWKRVQAERSEYKSALKEQTDQLETLRKQLESCSNRLVQTEERCVLSCGTESSAYPTSIHLNRRGQVVQLYRRGENARTIASALGMSQGEVKLMIKLHEMNGTATPQKN